MSTATAEETRRYKVTAPTASPDGKPFRGADQRTGLSFKGGVAYTEDPEVVRNARAQSGWIVEDVTDGEQEHDEEDEQPKRTPKAVAPRKVPAAVRMNND